MKKDKLNLSQLEVQSFKTSLKQSIKGGAESDGSLCESINWCETCDYSACGGGGGCQLYQSYPCSTRG